MYTSETQLNVKISRTLWFNMFRGQVTDALGEFIANLRITPAIPLDRSEVPEEAPEVIPHLIVLVEDADLGTNDFIDFECKMTDILIDQLSRETFQPKFCLFFYPSPVNVLDNEAVAN